jgi:hypothetical protein
MARTRRQQDAAASVDGADSGAAADSAPDGKKASLWSSYQSLLVRHPLKMQVLQTGVIGCLANVTGQAIGGSVFSLRPVVEQAVLGMCFIAPIVSCWFSLLGRLKLHWLSATVMDQFLFSPLFNVAIFTFISAVFKGGVSFSTASSPKSDTLNFTMSLHPSLFPSLYTYEPVHSTQVTAYYVWLPATVVRECFVPPHLKGVFVNAVSFVWNVIFSLIMMGS